ncbi:RDD family protein [Desulfobacter postgatei]|uniref:RDD family protein n=1 Tax=Desulfobacter postgatei TaxID=2293 RepID=UPI002A366280|nr:RDD family protein [Desulfobacter postgatei]MDX9964264.1 RDD family protein [Desulfobacter postgatei]
MGFILICVFLLTPFCIIGADEPLSFQEWKAEKEKRSAENQQLEVKENQEPILYRNDEYRFRINFPAGWEMKDGDGEHVVKKAVKDGATVMVLVNADFINSSLTKEDQLSEKDIESAELNDFSDEEANTFLETIISAQLESFPGSTILEKGIRYVDNRKAVYFKMNQVYRVQDIKTEGISMNYFTVHKGKLYQIGGMYPTVPINEEGKESIINTSLATFVFEDWINQDQNINIASSTVDSSDMNKLKIQAQNEVLDNFSKSFIAGLFLVILAVVTGSISWLYSKITGKNIQAERTENDLIVVSKVKRLANFAIDFSIIINGLFALISYLAIQNAWHGFFENYLFFWISGIILYYFLFEWIFGLTPGKFITRTKVITTNGNKPNFSQILGRTLTRLVPLEMLSFMGKDPLGWHDKWSNTLVVRSGYNFLNKLTPLETKFCKECGNKIDALNTICNKCGKEIIKK